MQQELRITASNSKIIDGIKDFSELLYNQVAIKPIDYMPVIAYLKKYALALNPEYNRDEQSETRQETTVFCVNSNIISAIESSKKLFEKQVKIKPEVYMILISQLDKFAEVLKAQDKGENVFPLIETKTVEVNPPRETQSATKNEEQNLGKVKGFFD